MTLIAVGDMVARCAEAATKLAEEGISAAVINMASIKPIDAELICQYAEKTGCIVTAEDHNVKGGLGGAVAEVVVANKPVPMEFVGIQDVFGRSGSPAELSEVYGLTVDAVVAAAKKAVARK